ncbi:glycerate kinase type-2 family protein [Pelagibacterium sp.]|uniref:glycerate kinase type-2 family protein n=1 Tax=Pelagibacterium sp. TaxID=1967288 RepID=UPI003A8D22C9
MDERAFLTRLFEAAVKAADPFEQMRQRLPPKPKGRTLVVGAGKAAAQMAQALETLIDWPVEGVVVDRHGAVANTRDIKVLHAAHPVPDAAGMAAASTLLDAVKDLGKDDLVIALISGGGSALLPSPAGDLTLEDEIELNRALLASGAPISVMNACRTQISRIKGGRLAQAAAPAKVVSFIVSDVVGDDPSIVASGPTVPGQAAPSQDVLDAIEQFRIALPAAIRDHIAAERTPAPAQDDATFERNEVHVIASASLSLEAAAHCARELGITPILLSEAIEGEAKDIGKMHAAIALQFAKGVAPFSLPTVLISGGETTVTLGDRSPGRGGRNTEFLLSFALDIAGARAITALAADTDGIDGSQDNAGAFADGTSVSRMLQKGINPKSCLAAHDAWHAFDASGDLFVTGPTGTNVNDFRAILIGAVGTID